MITIQFDECFDDVEVIEACNAEQRVQALRLDDDLFEKKDPVVLSVLMKRSTPMITTDRSLPDEHADCIPEQNPGIVVVAYCRFYRSSREALKTMTTKAASRLLRQLKAHVPEWYNLDILPRQESCSQF